MWPLKNPLILALSALIILGGMFAIYRITKIAPNANQESSNKTNKKAEFVPEKGEFILAVGDFATCASANDDLVAKSLKTFDGRLILLGDTVYDSGSSEEYANCFDPLLGSELARVFPAPGNHEYRTKDAADYFQYFGESAGSNQGYYSFEYGQWQIIALNSNCSEVGCEVGSAQLNWLSSELESSDATCQLAFYHHPRFSSGSVHGSNTTVNDMWRLLTTKSVDVVLSGHEHLYERFAKLNEAGDVSNNGTRQFIVGTGGRSLYKFSNPLPGSEVRDNQHYGFLKMELLENMYKWEFIDTKTGKVVDFGNDSCK